MVANLGTTYTDTFDFLCCWLQKLLIGTTAVALPFAQQLLVAYLWAAPLSLPSQQRLVFFLRRLSAWTTYEVLVCAILASAYGTEFSTFTRKFQQSLKPRV